jgi:hypothetical protein
MNGYPNALRPGDHLRLAEDFFQAYLDLPRRPPPQSWPRYLMLCHTVEPPEVPNVISDPGIGACLMGRPRKNAWTVLALSPSATALALGVPVRRVREALDSGELEALGFLRYPMVGTGSGGAKRMKSAGTTRHLGAWR